MRLRSSKTLTAISLTLTLTLGLTTPAPAEAAEDNAALKYWQAFALLPSLNKSQETLLANWNTVPLDKAALELIATSKESRALLLRGAKLRTCDWGLSYDEGIWLLLPHLAKARDLARLAALHARAEIEQGHATAAADDATAILALARHVGSDPIAISILVRYLIEGTAIDLVAAHLSELRTVSPGIMAAYDALPPGATFQTAYLTTEKEHTVRWLATALRTTEAQTPGGWRAVWKRATDRPEGLEVINRVDSADEAIRLTEALLPVCDDLAKLVALPKDEFDARYPEFRKKTKAAHPLAGYFLTTPDTVLAAQHRNEARIALLRAAIALDQGGPDPLKTIKDPFGTGPFEYRSLDQGFELKSKLLFQGQPVTLKVKATPKKP